MREGIRWMSLPPGSGYGEASREYLAGLRAAGVPVTWTPLGWHDVLPGSTFGPARDPQTDGLEHGDLVGRAVAHDTVVVHATPFWHDWLARQAEGRRLVAYTTWETDRLPPERVAILNRYDAVLVPSAFNRSVLVASGVEPPVEVVPHALPPVALSGRAAGPAGAPAKPAGRARDRPFTCYLLATWSARKAIPDAVEAFCRAFDATDPVRLVIQSGPTDLVAARARRLGRDPGGSDATWFSLARLLAGRPGAPEILLRTRHLDEAGVAALHDEGDCFLLLSRGEGWGLGAFAAAAAGNPVVVTGWGATPEYLPTGYPYLVDHDLAPARADPLDLLLEAPPSGRWARARVDHAAELLRQVYERPDEAAAWARRAQEELHARYHRARVTRRLLTALASAHAVAPPGAPGVARR